jgi:hypothetical protein
MADTPLASSVPINSPRRVDRTLPLVLVVLLVCGLVPLLCHQMVRRHTIEADTRSELSALAFGCESFFEAFNRWPTNLDELRHNSRRHLFYTGALFDCWGQRYIYLAPTADAPGQVLTFGADANPHGNATDGDAAVLLKLPAKRPARPKDR